MSRSDAAARRDALSTAFSAFTSVSRDLEASYGALETRVAELRAELAHADRELEARLEEQRRLAARFARLVEALPGGVVVLDAQGLVQECNPAAERLLGTPLRGARWREVAAAAFAPRPDDGHDITLATGYRVNLSTCSLSGEPGQILHLADVTETRRLQERAARLERLTSLGRTVAALAHQIRTPLGAALLYASALPAGSARENVLGRLRKLESLVEDMLAYARQGELAVDPLDVAELLREVAERQLDPWRSRLALVGCEPGATFVPVVTGNRDALASALQNLLDNAWQSSPSAWVCLGLGPAPERGWLELTCADDGPGISPEIAARLFEPFVSTRENGTGLGLAIVRAIVEAHGGRVAVETTAGTGTTFTVSLPLAPGSGERSASPARGSGSDA